MSQERKVKELEEKNTNIGTAKDGEQIKLSDNAIASPQLEPVEPRIITEKIECPVGREWDEVTKKCVPKEEQAKPSRGIYLVAPHGRWIAEGKKTIVIKSKRFDLDEKEPLYLLEDSLCWGIISLSTPEEINYHRFDETRNEHKITDDEAFRRWGWTRDKPLYLYKIQRLDIWKHPKPVKIPRGVQVFVNAENIEFKEFKNLSLQELEYWHAYAHGRKIPRMHFQILKEFNTRAHPHLHMDYLDRIPELMWMVRDIIKEQKSSGKDIEELIKDWKSYNVSELIKTAGGRSILADDHRIVHTWWNNLQKGKAMKSPQFKDYGLNEQKRIVKRLHERIVSAFEKLKWNHKTPMSDDELAFDAKKITQADMENIDDTFIKKLTDSQLKELHDKVHAVFKEIGKVTEPVQNAHIFIWNAMRSRGIQHGPMEDKLDEETALEVVEYPKPEGLKDEILLKDVLDAFPERIVLTESPQHVHLVGRIVNEGRIPLDHDIDLLFKQKFSDVRIIYEFLKGLRAKNPEIAKRIHFVFDPWGPQIGYSVPLYHIAYQKLGDAELVKHHPFEYLAKEQSVKPMTPFRSLKVQTGFNKHEFFDPQMLWDNWAADHIGKGIVLQKKYDGMRFQIHRDGDQIKIITEDKQRDRADIFKKSIKELLDKSKEKQFILDAEMVEYDCRGKQVNDKEAVCDTIPRENMIPWVTAEKKVMDDEGITFHIHDCLYIGKEGDIHDKGYLERYNKIKEIISGNLEHWRIVPSAIANDKRSFEAALNKVVRIRGSEGAMLKVKDSPYLLSGRTPEWAKIKNVKEIDVMVWKVIPKINKKTGQPMPGQYMYDAVFQVPCNMEGQIVEDRFVKEDGKCYSIIGRTYSTGVKASKGDIITVQPIRVAEMKKGDKIFYTWMFPNFKMKRIDKHEPDTIDTVRKLIKKGTEPLSDEVIKIRLLNCPFSENSSTCPLKERFFIPRDQLSAKFSKEYLKFPIACPHAFHFRCRFIKGYYYGEKMLGKIKNSENLSNEPLYEEVENP